MRFNCWPSEQRWGTICSTRGDTNPLRDKTDSSQQLFNSTPHELSKYSHLFKMRKLKWLKGMKSLFIKHEYFITKSTNETKHLHNISSARIKETLLPSEKPNLSHHNFNQHHKCLRWCSKDKQAGAKTSIHYGQHPLLQRFKSREE